MFWSVFKVCGQRHFAPGLKFLLQPFRLCRRGIIGESTQQKMQGRFSEITALIIALAAREGSPGCFPFREDAPTRVAPAVFSYCGISFSAIAKDPAKNPVLNGPGSTTVTRIPKGATSAASASEMPSTANFVEL